jgi:serine/threonine-protein kinase
MAPLDIGARVGPYVILAHIAHGGMGTVYRARHVEQQREVALKVIRADHEQDESVIRRFQREAQAAAQIEHPNVVRVYELGEDASTRQRYIAMELIAGGTLQRRLRTLAQKSSKLPISDALRMTRDIASALALAHRKGLVHRDVKPSNVLLREDGGAVLGDFGVVLMSTATKITSSLATIGTPDYMSPEQCKGQALDGRSDIYSLGIVLFEALSGKLPFSGDSPIAVVYQHVNEALPDISKLRSDASPALRELIARMTAKDAAQRPTAADVVSAVDAQLDAGKPANPATPPRLQARWLVPIAGALVTVVLGATLLPRLAGVASTPADTATATPAITNATTVVPPTIASQNIAFYDSFDSAQFDGAINTRLWQPGGMGDVSQRGGVLTIRKFELRTAGGPRIAINRLDKTRGFRAFRARIRPLKEGARLNGYIGLVLESQLVSGFGLHACGVEVLNGGENIGFISRIIDQGETDAKSSDLLNTVDQWHAVALTYDTAARTLTCTVNGTFRHAHTIKSDEMARYMADGRFTLEINAEADMQAVGRFEIDDVVVEQSD